ncbi:hypothetical protein PQR64_30335 [Paraburkholderia phytofirmans]|uniref:hypothetical protein n=1 Tax=Paraburkholderia phytofirmans TaxID=261302 RepID=UPI0038B8D8CE
MSDSHMKTPRKKSGKGTAFGKSDSLARQGSLAGLAGAGLILSRNPAMDRLGSEPRPVVSVCACAGKRTHDTYVDKLSENSAGPTEHALSMPGFTLHHNISKSLRCYKRETLCKPLFSKTVLQWQLACDTDSRGGPVSSCVNFAGKR